MYSSMFGPILTDLDTVMNIVQGMGEEAMLLGIRTLLEGGGDVET